MKIAYVHDPPDNATIDTRWRNPKFLADQGFTDVVVGDQMSGVFSLVMFEADRARANAEISALNRRIRDALDAGLRPWVMEDLFTLSRQNARGNKGCSNDSRTWAVINSNIRRLFHKFPDLHGIIFRFGEAFETHDWAVRIDPLTCGCMKCSSMPNADKVKRIISELERTVCRNMGMRCVLRMWDLGDEGLHSDVSSQYHSLQAWGGNRRFIVSVKHTLTDYWRHQPWNPSILLKGPPRIVEFQCEREYEFLGLVPNWLGHHWALGFPETDEFGVGGLRNSRPPNWAGVYVIPRGGGWSAAHAREDLWAAMNVHAAIALCDDPKRSPDDILDEWLDCNGFEPGDARQEFHLLLTESADLILQLRYLPAYFSLTNQFWMPAENWFRDDTFVPGACAEIANVVTEREFDSALRADRAMAVGMATMHLHRAEKLFESGGSFYTHDKAEFILGSYHWALRFAEFTEALWDELLEAAPLDREAAKRIIQNHLKHNPLPPLDVLE